MSDERKDVAYTVECFWCKNFWKKEGKCKGKPKHIDKCVAFVEDSKRGK